MCLNKLFIKFINPAQNSVRARDFKCETNKITPTHFRVKNVSIVSTLKACLKLNPLVMDIVGL